MSPDSWEILWRSSLIFDIFAAFIQNFRSRILEFLITKFSLKFPKCGLPFFVLLKLSVMIVSKLILHTNVSRRESFIWRTVPFSFILSVQLALLVEIRPGTWNELECTVTCKSRCKNKCRKLFSNSKTTFKLFIYYECFLVYTWVNIYLVEREVGCR